MHLMKQEEITRMLKYYIKTREAVERLRTDKDGVVSFEYVIVAACVVAAVVIVFGTANGTGPIATALTDAIAAIVAKITPAAA
jgi:pilus assembly protein Flp/PilA